MTKLATTLSLLALAAGGLVACGGDDETTSAGATTSSTAAPGTTGSTGGDASTISITADPDGALAYEETSVSAPAGDLTIEFDNPASIAHDVVVEDGDGDELARTEVISSDATTTSAALDAGDYTFYCSVDAHREAGMEGTLTAQ